jgi:hypothetical protein
MNNSVHIIFTATKANVTALTRGASRSVKETINMMNKRMIFAVFSEIGVRDQGSGASAD